MMKIETKRQKQKKHGLRDVLSLTKHVLSSYLNLLVFIKVKKPINVR